MSATAETIIDFDVERRWRDAREAYDTARSSTVAFGRIMAELRQQYPHGTWGAELERRGFNRTHVADAIRQSADPCYAERRKATKRASRHPPNVVAADNTAPQPTQAAALLGEGNEAWRGMKAAAHRAATRPAEENQWRQTARGHLRRLVELSGMDKVAGVSVDEIMERITPFLKRSRQPGEPDPADAAAWTRWWRAKQRKR